ncbi:MAG: type II toxin-antitoxin system VapC family toxin [Chloroflexi bacterium]|nr:type II toxin-antitoxin system VapC family toxin [Chloroflexota bacterium]
MRYLADTNILARFVDKRHPHSSVARAALKTLAYEEYTLYVTSQNVIELWNVITRPADKNGLGRTPTEAYRILRLVERFFVVLPDTPQIYQEWRRLVIEYQVSGVQVHDARLVAAMRVHGVSHILTFNGKDFARYRREGIVAVAPDDDAIVRRVRENMERYQTATEKPADS